ncbi:hypothetical protein NCCP28_45710 [Niallia sp. NCCP-28]|nr:hypothetical protein NCCP28_45710 [Niallia sp. NCCP-28]
MFMKNKWLIAHPEREQLINKGAHPGIKGENIKVNIARMSIDKKSLIILLFNKSLDIISMEQ